MGSLMVGLCQGRASSEIPLWPLPASRRKGAVVWRRLEGRKWALRGGRRDGEEPRSRKQTRPEGRRENLKGASPKQTVDWKKAMPASTVEVDEEVVKRGAGRTELETLGHDELE